MRSARRHGAGGRHQAPTSARRWPGARRCPSDRRACSTRPRMRRARAQVTTLLIQVVSVNLTSCSRDGQARGGRTCVAALPRLRGASRVQAKRQQCQPRRRRPTNLAHLGGQGKPIGGGARKQVVGRQQQLQLLLATLQRQGGGGGQRGEGGRCGDRRRQGAVRRLRQQVGQHGASRASSCPCLCNRAPRTGPAHSSRRWGRPG